MLVVAIQPGPLTRVGAIIAIPFIHIDRLTTVRSTNWIITVTQVANVPLLIGSTTVSPLNNVGAVILAPVTHVHCFTTQLIDDDVAPVGNLRERWGGQDDQRGEQQGFIAKRFNWHTHSPWFDFYNVRKYLIQPDLRSHQMLNARVCCHWTRRRMLSRKYRCSVIIYYKCDDVLRVIADRNE